MDSQGALAAARYSVEVHFIVGLISRDGADID
jgi:hypothetical protein